MAGAGDEAVSQKPPTLGVGFGKESVSQPAAAVTALGRGLSMARQALQTETKQAREAVRTRAREERQQQRIAQAQQDAAQSGAKLISSLNKAAGGDAEEPSGATLRVGNQRYSFGASDSEPRRLDLRG